MNCVCISLMCSNIAVLPWLSKAVCSWSDFSCHLTMFYVLCSFTCDARWQWSAESWEPYSDFHSNVPAAPQWLCVSPLITPSPSPPPPPWQKTFYILVPGLIGSAALCVWAYEPPRAVGWQKVFMKSFVVLMTHLNLIIVPVSHLSHLSPFLQSPARSKCS